MPAPTPLVCSTRGSPKVVPRVLARLVRLGRYSALAAIMIGATPLAAPAQSIDLGNGLALVENGEISTDGLIREAAAANRHMCLVVVHSPGTLAPALGNVALSSKVAGGLAGSAQVTVTNSSFTIGLEAPTRFALSPKLPGPVFFSAEISGSGATNFAAMPAPAKVRIKRGVTDLRADLTAKIQGASFASGQYRAELVLRCE